MSRMNAVRISTSGCLLLASLLACSESPGWTGSVGTRNGVPVVSNPGVPLVPEAQEFVSALWSVKGAAWVNPSRVHVQAGLVTVVDPPANQIHFVSKAGGPGASVGRPGEGPGEFLRLLDALPDGDRLVVLDAGKSSVQKLDLQGNYLSSVPIDGQAWGGFLVEGGDLLLKGEFLSDPSAETTGDWVRVREGFPPVQFTHSTLDPLPEEEGVECSDLSAWAGGAARMRFTTPQIQLFDAAGALREEFTIALPVEAITEAERTSALDELRSSLTGRGLPPPFVQQNLVVMEERWRVKCRFGPLRTDPSGRLAAFLEQNPDEFGSGPASLHLLSGEGVYLAKIDFPTAWRDFAMDDGGIYALARDPVTDVVTLEAYRLDLPEALYARASAALEEARRGG